MRSPENVTYHNQFQVTQSNRFVFSLRSDFKLVDDILDESPIYGEADRKRVVTSHDDELGRIGDHHNA